MIPAERRHKDLILSLDCDSLLTPAPTPPSNWATHEWVGVDFYHWDLGGITVAEQAVSRARKRKYETTGQARACYRIETVLPTGGAVIDSWDLAL